MPMTHEDIQSLLPEYLSARLSPEAAEEVKTHISGCVDCQDQLTVLVELQQFPIADPGALFWKALPARVAREAGASGQQKRRRFPWVGWMWYPMPLAGAALVLALLIYARVASPPVVVSDAELGGDSNGYAADYGSLSEADIPGIDLEGETAAEEARVYDDPGGYAYHSELVALKTDEIDRLSRAMERYNPGGG